MKRSLFSRDAVFPFAYLMVLVMIGTTLRAFRDSLFLDRLGYESLPLTFLLTTLVSVAAAGAYVRLAARKSPVWIACFSLALFAVLFPAVYWWLPRLSWLYHVLYVSVAPFNA